VENQPVEIMAYMGKFAGVGNAYSMTPDEIAKAKDLLKQLKPNILKLADQATDTIALLKTGEAWIATGNLGTESRVKDQGGPDLNVFTPKEGTIGWMDSEMVVKGGSNTSLIFPFLELAEQAEYMAANFILNGRPLFNEAAYKILVNQGQQERADRFLYNKPETGPDDGPQGPRHFDPGRHRRVQRGLRRVVRRSGSERQHDNRDPRRSRARLRSRVPAAG